jgi:hypothetical protein
MPSDLEGKVGFLFLALGVQCGRVDGAVIGKDRWKGLWLIQIVRISDNPRRNPIGFQQANEVIAN